MEDQSEPTSETPESYCIYCGRHFESTKILSLPCGCKYCSGCLEDIYSVIFGGQHAQAPRCCVGIFPFDLARRHLKKQTVQAYLAHRAELEDPGIKTYCHDSRCGKLVAQHSIHNGQAFCQKCRAVTCSKCKAKWHFGPCAEGSEFKEVLQMAEWEGWKRCPRCLTMVELVEGCYHMECRCGQGFCYGCGKSRSQCACEDEDEDDY